MPRDEEERVLTLEELAELRQNFLHMSENGVEAAYVTAYEDCRLRGSHLPPAHAIQQLVTEWRVLHHWRRPR